MTLPVSEDRAAAARSLAALFTQGSRVALTTHVNADGDGLGSEVGLWHLLAARGVRATIANPTPIPERFAFLIPDGADQSDRAAKEIERADAVVVLDISDLGRIGDLGSAVQGRSPASTTTSAPAPCRPAPASSPRKRRRRPS